jgi:hypothetical protein
MYPINQPKKRAEEEATPSQIRVTPKNYQFIRDIKERYHFASQDEVITFLRKEHKHLNGSARDEAIKEIARKVQDHYEALGPSRGYLAYVYKMLACETLAGAYAEAQKMAKALAQHSENEAREREVEASATLKTMAPNPK